MGFKKAVLVGIKESSLSGEYWARLDELVESRVALEKGDPNIASEVADADCLLVGFQVKVDRQLIDAAPGLRYIGVLATAYGTIDVAYATQKGIPVCNLAGYSTEAVAEFTITAILYQIRQLEEGRTRAKAGDYSFEGMSARELKDSNFGVIGLGNIGNRVAELAAGFGANVHYWSRNKKDTPFTYVELNDLLTTCDYISVNVAETEETTGLLNGDNLSLLKSDTILISTVPPPVINTDALAERLSSGDVTFISDHPDEMTKEDLTKLKAYPNAVLYGPIGFITKEARLRMQELFIGNMTGFLEGKLQNVVS